MDVGFLISTMLPMFGLFLICFILDKRLEVAEKRICDCEVELEYLKDTEELI